MANVLPFLPRAADVCTLCSEPRAAHRDAKDRYVGCRRQVPAAEIRARLRSTLARCAGATLRPFGIDAPEVPSR